MNLNLIKLIFVSTIFFSSSSFAEQISTNSFAQQSSQRETNTKSITVMNHDKSNITVDSNTQKSDMKITNDILSKVSADPTVSRLNVNISTEQGTVTIMGDVDTKEDATALIQIAQSIPGVKDVDTSKLTIQKGELSLHDFIITAKIKGLFIREELFGDKDIAFFSIQVDTKNGVVFLTGTAENQAQIDNAIKIAKSVKGVQNVNTKINLPGSKN